MKRHHDGVINDTIGNIGITSGGSGVTRVDKNALKHGLSERSIIYAWEHYSVGAVRVPGEREVRIGFDQQTCEIEMVGVMLEDGEWLVYHANTPPTKKMKVEIEKARRRS